MWQSLSRKHSIYYLLFASFSLKEKSQQDFISDDAYSPGLA